MLSLEENQLLTHVGPGTPMGLLMLHHPRHSVFRQIEARYGTQDQSSISRKRVAARVNDSHTGISAVFTLA